MTQLFRLLAITLLTGASYTLQGQQWSSDKVKSRTMPDTIYIQKSEIEKLFEYKVNSKVGNGSSKYLQQALVLLNTTEKSPEKKDKLLRLKLDYFPDSYLWVQVNSHYSTQLFIMSAPPAAFYKSYTAGNNFVLVKCTREKIVSE